MGIKSTAKAFTALTSVKAANVRQEFALAKEMAQVDQAKSNVHRTVEKAEARVLKAAEKCELLSADLAQAETDLDVAKAELEQARANAIANPVVVPVKADA